jgi:glycosyltransferase involved in cell wall biosynthesis
VSRVAHILPWDAVGGTEVATLRIALAVRDAGYDSVAFVPGNGTALRGLFEARGIEVISYAPVEPSVRRPLPYMSNSRRLARSLRQSGADLVHFSEVLAALYGGMAARMARLPNVCHVRNRYAAFNRRDRLFLRLVSHFAFVSRATWHQFGHKVSEARGRVIYDGYATPETGEDSEVARAAVLAEFELPENAAIVGTLARVNGQKDFFTLARAAARVVKERPDTRFLVVGDNSTVPGNREHFAEVSAALEELGIRDSFVFTGFRTDTQRLLAAMDVFVLCTHAEGLPLVLLEAGAAGKPIVATAVDGVPEAVIHGETGFTAAEMDDEAFGGHILSLVDDADLRHRLGGAAKERVARDFSPAQFARSLASMYDSLLGSTPQPAP